MDIAAPTSSSGIPTLRRCVVTLALLVLVLAVTLAASPVARAEDTPLPDRKVAVDGIAETWCQGDYALYYGYYWYDVARNNAVYCQGYQVIPVRVGVWYRMGRWYVDAQQMPWGADHFLPSSEWTYTEHGRPAGRRPVK